MAISPHRFAGFSMMYSFGQRIGKVTHQSSPSTLLGVLWASYGRQCLLPGLMQEDPEFATALGGLA